ncbi:MULTISPECIES: hypothetical protein [unclassified Leifsonia]|uniref:hypothetical protein n=1 Tax=unclassified Leifsonia TaxID=2663824 RepID=UPI0008A7BC83|nr:MULTISPECIES: hypothetical protein [unclassified Leifsonia]SEH57430.1 hypothetical protein SAMN04515694_101176 [Leifsonia sp. CL154]SFL21438.1 hypothetical protein SAMN04515692_101303 [Leifsonia sp. CL147]
MAIRADTRRLLDAVATMEHAARKFRKIADFAAKANPADYRAWGMTMALDVREQIEIIEKRLSDLYRAADLIERKASR